MAGAGMGEGDAVAVGVGVLVVDVGVSVEMAVFVGRPVGVRVGAEVALGFAEMVGDSETGEAVETTAAAVDGGGVGVGLGVVLLQPASHSAKSKNNPTR